MPETSIPTWADLAGYLRGPDVSGWPVTSRVTDVITTDGLIAVEHTQSHRWLGSVTPLGPDPLAGNIWIIAQAEGRWYAATWDWLRPGQTRKHVTAEEFGRDQIRKAPLDATWPGPQRGELIGLFVSTLARDGIRIRDSGERSEVVWVRYLEPGIVAREGEAVPTPSPQPPPPAPPVPDDFKVRLVALEQSHVELGAKVESVQQRVKAIEVELARLSQRAELPATATGHARILGLRVPITVTLR